MNSAIIIRTVVYALVNLLWLLEILLFIRALISWIPEAENNKFSQFIIRVTEPLLIPFRELVSRSAIGEGFFLDISFIVVLLILEMCRRFLESLNI